MLRAKWTTTMLLMGVGFFLLRDTPAVAQVQNNQGFNQQNQQQGGNFGQNRFGQPGQASNQSLDSPIETQQIGRDRERGRDRGQRGNLANGTQDNFVGSNAEQIRQQNRERRGNRRRTLFDFAVESLNEMRESQRRSDAQRNRQPPVRVKLRPLFTAPALAGNQLSSQVRDKFNQALPANNASTEVMIRGGTATIRGTVDSDYEKQLAAKMLSIQPGIQQVENELTVGPTLGPNPGPAR